MLHSPPCMCPFSTHGEPRAARLQLILKLTATPLTLLDLANAALVGLLLTTRVLVRVAHDNSFDATPRIGGLHYETSTLN